MSNIELSSPVDTKQGQPPEQNLREKPDKRQPWKQFSELAQRPKTWEEMPYKIVDEKEIRLVDVYRVLQG